MRADRIWIAAATPICAGLLYFLLAGEVNTSETLAGAVVVVLGSSYAVALGVCPPPPNTTKTLSTNRKFGPHPAIKGADVAHAQYGVPYSSDRPWQTNLFRGSLYTWNVAASGGAHSDMA